MTCPSTASLRPPVRVWMLPTAGGAIRWALPSSEPVFQSCAYMWLACPQAADGLVDAQKIPAAADGCVFGGLRAGSLYRLQVASWSRDMSSDSSTLARTG